MIRNTPIGSVCVRIPLVGPGRRRPEGAPLPGRTVPSCNRPIPHSGPYGHGTDRASRAVANAISRTLRVRVDGAQSRDRRHPAIRRCARRALPGDTIDRDDDGHRLAPAIAIAARAAVRRASALPAPAAATRSPATLWSATAVRRAARLCRAAMRARAANVRYSRLPQDRASWSRGDALHAASESAAVARTAYSPQRASVRAIIPVAGLVNGTPVSRR